MRQPLKQVAYDFVMERITSGQYAAGMRLPEVALAREIGVSPTPLREAYRQLASEGLLEHRPHAGVFVRTLDQEEIRELYELREAIECFCAAKATQWMNKVQTDRLEGFVMEMASILDRSRRRNQRSMGGDKVMEFLAADQGFHALIIASSANAAFDRIVSDYQALAKLMTANRFRHTIEQIDTTVEHHRAILNAIRKHDPEDAARCMKRHIRFSRDAVLEQLAEAVGRDTPSPARGAAPFSPK
jgi:DNA-binding GntR family transcriptional regulator